MLRTATVLTVVGLLLSTSACGSPDPADPAPAAPPSTMPPSVAPLHTPSTAVSPGLPGRPPTTAGTPRVSRTSRSAATSPPPSGGEVPGPLPFGARTLTGTVERARDCTMLLVGERRWGLTGEAATALSAGDRVTVYGTLAPRPAACGERDLAQTVAVDRVERA